MILLRRPAESFHSYSRYDSYQELHSLIQEFLKNEYEIKNRRDEISRIMSFAMRRIKEKTAYNKAKSIHRKAYHRFDMLYDVDFFINYCIDIQEDFSLFYHDAAQRRRNKILDQKIMSKLDELYDDMVQQINDSYLKWR